MTVYAIGATSSGDYEVGIALTFEQNSSAYQNTIVHIQPLLKRKKSVTRYQHSWYVHFAVDNKPVVTVPYLGSTGDNALPNNTAKDNVVGSGRLYMEANTWYKWGNAHSTVIPNDGNTHNVGINMNCIETIPRYCPAEGQYLWAYFSTPRYNVPAPKPKGVYTTFDPNTRELKYYWDTADCAFILLWRNWHTVEGTIIQGGYVSVNGTGKIYNVDCPYKEVLPDNISYVTYEMVNFSSTNDSSTTGGLRATWRDANGNIQNTFPTDCKVWVNVNGTWVKAVPWVKTSEGWKKASKTYVKVNGAWQRTIM